MRPGAPSRHRVYRRISSKQIALTSTWLIKRDQELVNGEPVPGVKRLWASIRRLPGESYRVICVRQYAGEMGISTFSKLSCIRDHVANPLIGFPAGSRRYERVRCTGSGVLSAGVKVRLVTGGAYS